MEDNELKEDNYFISKANSNLIELESNHNFLIFEDSIAVIKTLNALEDSSNSRYFQFLDKYRNLEPEEIIFLLDSLNFNDESYLDFFEEQFSGFLSLRKSINLEMKNHLNQSIFDWENSPDNHFIFNPYLRTILNKDNAIQIGDTIYVLVNNGWYKFIDKSLYLFVVNAIVTYPSDQPIA